MEILDLVDESGRPTGRTAARAQVHRLGLCHRTSHVWVLRRREGRWQVLLQKRSEGKDSFPGCWDCSSAGHIPAGVDFVPSALRELREELGISAAIRRPLWLNQGFFTEDVDQLRYHELCLYFLIDFAGTDLLARGRSFRRDEGVHSHQFTWLPFESLVDAYFYPIFLKREIFHLPEQLTLRTEVE